MDIACSATYNSSLALESVMMGTRTCPAQVGTFQQDALQNIRGSIEKIRTMLNHIFAATGAFTGRVGAWGHDANDGGTETVNFYFDASNVARTSTETRPYNIALMYLIRAISQPLEPVPVVSMRIRDICDVTGAQCFTPETVDGLLVQVASLLRNQAQMNTTLTATNDAVTSLSTQTTVLGRGVDGLRTR